MLGILKLMEKLPNWLGELKHFEVLDLSDNQLRLVTHFIKFSIDGILKIFASTSFIPMVYLLNYFIKILLLL